MKRRSYIPLLVGVALCACMAGDTGPMSHRLLAMGTWVDIAIDGVDDERAANVIAEVESMLRDFERDYYAWGDGELARLNAALAVGESFEASAGMAELLRSAQDFSRASDGSFDPGTGKLTELWGFHDATAEPSDPPPAASLRTLIASGIGIGGLQIDGLRVTSQSTETLIDLGGIAKGQAVDNIIEFLGQRQITTAMVNAGGDLRVIGAPVGRQWRVGIQAPRGDDVIAAVELDSGEAAFTSGDYERFYERDGERLHHLLDPATGYPATHTQAVTVIGPDGVTADAAATAIFVAGPERWPRVASALGIDLVLRVDASGRIESTPRMRDRLQISAGASLDIIDVRY